MARLSLWVDRSRLARIREFVVEVGHEIGLDGSTLYDLQLAVDEACTNVVEHGYDGQGGRIEVVIESADGGVRVIVRDWGLAFDPKAVPQPDVTAPLEQRPLGGLGLFLIRHVMDDIKFEFDAKNGNTLTMFKHLHGEKS